MVKADFNQSYTVVAGRSVQCELCPTYICVGVTGWLQERENREGGAGSAESGKRNITKSRKERLVHGKPIWFAKLALIKVSLLPSPSGWETETPASGVSWNRQ